MPFFNNVASTPVVNIMGFYSRAYHRSLGRHEVVRAWRCVNRLPWHTPYMCLGQGNHPA